MRGMYVRSKGWREYVGRERKWKREEKNGGRWGQRKGKREREKQRKEEERKGGREREKKGG